MTDLKSKLLLSINKKADAKTNKLARRENKIASHSLEKYIERKSDIDEKLQAKERISGILDAEMATEEDDHYFKEIHKKHGWE